MSLKHTMLVLLASEQGSGYDIVKSFKRGIGYFWNATHQQVYQELKKMDKEGWVEFEVEAQQGKPDRKVYRLTSDGREALAKWLAEPTRIPRVNDALLVKLYAGELNDRETLITEVKTHYQHYLQLMDVFAEIEDEYQGQTPEQQARWRLPYLTLKRGVYTVEAWLRWADEILEELEGGGE